MACREARITPKRYAREFKENALFRSRVLWTEQLRLDYVRQVLLENAINLRDSSSAASYLNFHERSKRGVEARRANKVREQLQRRMLDARTGAADLSRPSLACLTAEELELFEALCDKIASYANQLDQLALEPTTPVRGAIPKS